MVVSIFLVKIINILLKIFIFRLAHALLIFNCRYFNTKKKQNTQNLLSLKNLINYVRTFRVKTITSYQLFYN